MARTVLSEAELIGLIEKIIHKGHADTIIRWMDTVPDTRPSSETLMRWESLTRKELGFDDFQMQIPTFLVEGNSVLQAEFQLWRPSRWFGYRGATKLYYLMRNTCLPRYEKAMKEGKFIPEGDFYSYTKWTDELQINLDCDSSGQADPRYTDIRNDFVVFRFKRIHDRDPQ